jgi:hypothetical protein
MMESINLEIYTKLSSIKKYSQTCLHNGIDGKIAIQSREFPRQNILQLMDFMQNYTATTKFGVI